MDKQPAKTNPSVSKKRVVQIEVLKKRLETIPNKLEMDETKWGKLCHMVLPEFFEGPKNLGMPATSPPGTPERIELYAQRVQNREEVFQPLDCLPNQRTL